MNFDRNQPYNELPPLPPGIELETKPILKLLVQAHKALAELRGYASRLPNQSVLIQTLGLQEAKLSSEIENIVTTNDELYRGFADEDVESLHPNTKEVLRYKDALWHGFNAIRKKGRPLTTRLFEEIFQIIKHTDDGVRRLPGTKLYNPLMSEILYTPPDGEKILREKLKNLEEFLHMRNDLDPLVKMAAAHYQFEAIHPFTDGNGRTGRVINLLYLIDQHLLDTPILYLSRYIMENKDGYYNGLQAVTEYQSWEEWIIYMLHAVIETALTTQKKVFRILTLIHETSEQIKEQLPKIYSKDLVDVLFWQPYCRIRFLEEAGIAQRQTASKYLGMLAMNGILKHTVTGRNAYYINEKFLKLLIED